MKKLRKYKSEIANERKINLSLVKRIWILADNSKCESNVDVKRVKFQNEAAYRSTSNRFNPYRVFKDNSCQRKSILKSSKSRNPLNNSNFWVLSEDLETNQKQSFNTIDHPKNNYSNQERHNENNKRIKPIQDVTLESPKFFNNYAKTPTATSLAVYT